MQREQKLAIFKKRLADIKAEEVAKVKQQQVVVATATISPPCHNNNIANPSPNAAAASNGLSISNGGDSEVGDGNTRYTSNNFDSSDAVIKGTTTTTTTSGGGHPLQPHYPDVTGMSLNTNGLRNRTKMKVDDLGGHHGEQQQLYCDLSAEREPMLTNSAVSDLERSASLKGITVLRGRVPKRGQYGEDHVESYL